MRQAKTVATFGLRGLPAVGAVKNLRGRQESAEPDKSDDKRKPLHRRPRGIQGKKWTRGDERMFESIRDSCLADKPRCTTKYTKGRRVRKCYRDCQKVAAATVNKRRKERAQ